MATASPTPEEPAAVDALMARAHREHRAGRLAEAAAAYREILAIRPDLAEAHNFLGIALAQQGNLEEARARFAEAVALKPNYAEAHNNLGNVLLSQGQLDQAAAHYERAISVLPGFAEAHNNLGNVRLSQGKLDEAAARFSQAIALRPGYTEAHNSLGNVLLRQGKLDQAQARFEQVLAQKPDFAEAHNSLGNVLWKQDKFDEAQARFERAVALRPNYAEAHNNLGITLAQQNRFAEAQSRFEQAIALRPQYTEAYNNLGIILWRQGRLDEAAARYQQALALKPDHAEAHNNLGIILWKRGQLDEAAAHSERALALRPDFAEAHNNLGNVLFSHGELDQAAARFAQALALKPDFAEAHNNLAGVLRDQGKIGQAAEHYQQALTLRPEFAEAQLGIALCHLVEADYERGWPAYEGRLRVAGVFEPPNLPPWRGEPLAGRGLLLVAEQGMGDTIHFVRYARLLKQRGARVVLACQAALGRLLASYPDLDQLVFLGSNQELPRLDFYLPLLSAPGMLGTNASTIPGEVPYLMADPALTELWRKELAGIDGYKIGVVWQGARGFTSDRQRSIPLAEFAPLARLPGVRLVSLQKGFGSEQVAEVDFPILDFSSRLDEAAGPLMDTAAVIGNLDLVVAPDTAIAHLAGALGAPVWAAIQFSPNWRWLLDREDSPWYPTMRIFRQTRFGHWTDVFKRMADTLQARRSETA
ncbi:MAG TPA: tetratricopeptide repeat protein [Pirellulales bacterium]|jgi:Tfp pilus assembly protein PilF|nr:tetratricopeptide repeat protein [Pirellulales bacterium]